MLSVLALSALVSHGAGVRRHGNVSFVFMMVSCICCNYVAIYPVMDYTVQYTYDRLFFLKQADDMGIGDPGFNGGRAKTPFLDAMARANSTLLLKRS